MAEVPPIIDCRGLECPLPIIQVRLRLNEAHKGDQFLIYADDSTFESEFARFCVLADIKLNEKKEMGDFQSYLITSLV